MMFPMRLIRLRFLVLTILFMTQGGARAGATSVPDAASMLQHDMQHELGVRQMRPRQTQRAMALTVDVLDQANGWPQDAEIVLVVDRAPTVQLMWFVLADTAAHQLTPLGMVAVSTGRPGRKEHFRTPVGIFVNDGQIYGYRALGTKNEHGIRGNGEKGMRVWDFGWQTTEDWRRKGSVAVVRLEMHATDPTFLESRLGQADSEGCIRIPARVNSFIDRHGLLDRQLDLIAQTDPQKARGVRALLGAEHVPTALEGDRVIVIDTSDPQAPLSDPAQAQKIQADFAQFLAASNTAGQPSPAAQSPSAPPSAGPRPIAQLPSRPQPAVAYVPPPSPTGQRPAVPPTPVVPRPVPPLPPAQQPQPAPVSPPPPVVTPQPVVQPPGPASPPDDRPPRPPMRIVPLPPSPGDAPAPAPQESAPEQQAGSG